MIHLQCICLNNGVKHMETKLAGGGEEQTAPQQLNGVQGYRDGTSADGCRDQLLNVLQNKMMILRYNYLKFKYAYRIVQLLQSIKCKRSCSSHFYYLDTVDKCAIERFYRCTNSS